MKNKLQDSYQKLLVEILMLDDLQCHKTLLGEAAQIGNVLVTQLHMSSSEICVFHQTAMRHVSAQYPYLTLADIGEKINLPLFEMMDARRQMIHQRLQHLEDTSESNTKAIAKINFALNLEKERLKLSKQVSSSGIWEWDIVRNHLEWDDRMLELYQISRDEFGQNYNAWFNRIHPDDQGRIQREAQLALSGKKTYACQFRLNIPNGSIRHIKAEATIIRDDDQQPIMMIGINTDITHEVMVVERQRLADLVISHANDVVIITEGEPIDERGPRVIFANKAFERLTGYTQEDIIGKTPRILQGPDSNRTTLDRIRHALKSWKPIQEEVLNYKKNGEAFWVELNITPVVDEAGKYTHWVSIQRDITERKQVELRLQHALEQANAAVKAKSRFLANMSHEIRTPLNGILGMTQILNAVGAPDETAKKYIRIINESAQTLDVILNDILDFSTIEAGKLQLFHAPFSAYSLVTETAELFLPIAEKKGLCLEVDCHGVDGRKYLGDRIRLRQMLSNLISNAIKFTQQGYVRVKIEEISPADDVIQLIFSVHDSGMGIPADKQAEIFEPFTQVDESHTRRLNGTGLGLAIVCDIAKQMCGWVTVSSELGRGSCFSFQIPVKILKEQTLLPDDAPMPKQPMAGWTENSKLPLILVVDDNAINAQVAKALLSRLDCKAESFDNGQEAVNAIRRGVKPDLILMDLQMPVMDGITTTILIRQYMAETRQPHPPIIALSAAVYPDDMQKCFDVGMKGFLAKPIKLEALKTILHQWITD